MLLLCSETCVSCSMEILSEGGGGREGGEGREEGKEGRKKEGRMLVTLLSRVDKSSQPKSCSLALYLSLPPPSSNKPPQPKSYSLALYLSLPPP